MNRDVPPEWAEMFNAKTYDELLKLDAPDGLDDEEEDRYWEAWGNAAEAAEQKQQQVPLADETAASESARSNSTTAVPEDREKPAYGTPLPPLAIPEGSTDVLLDRQIATCVGLIDHLAHYVARCDTDPYNCNNFMDRIVSMMNSSANVAKMVGRLRGSLQPDEKQLRQIIQHEDGPGERPPSPR